MREMDITPIYPKMNLSKRMKQAKVCPYLLRNAVIDRSNQAWSIDITYIPMKHGFLYLTAIIDWYSRCIVGWDVDDTLDTTMVINACKKAFKVAKPLIINSDQGSQFTSDKYIEFIRDNGIRQSMDGKSRWADVMYWHWSPNNGWAMNHQIKGHNECHIVYILGASSPTYPIAESVYHKGWANANTFLNGREYYGIKLPLGNNHGKGGPLFFTHYSYMGLDPRGLKDRYADYEEQMKAHTLINRAYCIDNPKGYKGYGEKCWGLTASDGDKGYSAHSPGNDRGVITPTAALSSIPYAPEYSLEAMRYFYEELGDRLWGEYGFKDAFNLTENWFAPSYLAIDQGPIIVMIENYRTGLIWKLFMSHPDVQKGLRRLGFTSPYLNKVD